MLSDEDIHGLYAMYGHVLYRRCRRILRDDDAARDALQEVFYAVVRYRHSYQQRADISHWLHRLTTNCCLRQLRRSKNRPEYPGVPGETMPDPPAGGNLAEDLVQRQLVLRLLSAFDEKTQAVAMCTFIEGLLQEETAHAMGISSRAVRKRLNRFKKKSKALMARWEGGGHVSG